MIQRESPAINICRELLQEGVNLVIYDPQVNKKQIENDLQLSENQNKTFEANEGTWKFSKTIIECTINADAILILTEWSELKKLTGKKFLIE